MDIRRTPPEFFKLAQGNGASESLELSVRSIPPAVRPSSHGCATLPNQVLISGC